MTDYQTSHDSQLIKLLLHFPARAGLILYFFVLPVNDWLSEVLLWTSCASTSIYILIHLFSPEKKFRLFRLGGEIALLFFIIAVVVSWSLNDLPILQQLFHLRWILFLYLMTYIFDIFPNLNGRAFLLMLSGLATAGFGLFQAFSGTQLEFLGLVNHSQSSPFSFLPHYSQGFFLRREEFGIFLALISPFPLAAWIYRKRPSGRTKTAVSLITLSFFLAIALTFHAAAILTFGCCVVTLFIMKKKFFTSAAIIGLLSLSSYSVGWLLPEEALQEYRQSNDERAVEMRQDLRKSLETFKQKPWLGTGFSLDSQRSPSHNPAPNTYFHLLASTGLIGFTAFMLLCLSYLFINLQLIQEIPPTHGWHRVILMGSLASQVGFHFAGIFIWSLGQTAILHVFIISLAFTTYLSERYARGIVSDDYSL